MYSRTTPAGAGHATRESIAGMFAKLAPDYDRFNRLSSLGLDRSWRRRAVRLAGLKRNARVLDLAAGTGDLTMELVRAASPASILSTDLVPEMLDVGMAKAAEYTGDVEIDFAMVDAQALPFPDESFDAVTIAFGVRNLPERAVNFREVHRVLKPGGRYVVLEMSRPPFPPLRSLYHFYLQTVMPALGSYLTGSRDSFDYLRESIVGFPGQVALAGELHRVGFKEVMWRNLTFGIVAVHVATK